MSASFARLVRRLRITLLIPALINGCATDNVSESIAQTNEEAVAFSAGNLELAFTDEQRVARLEISNALLAEPLNRDDAVQLALANSPAVQALIARRWETGANAAQSGRIPNPVFSFERLISDDTRPQMSNDSLLSDYWMFC